MKKLITILLITFSLQGIGQEIAAHIDSADFSKLKDSVYDVTNIFLLDDTFDWGSPITPFKYQHNPIDLMLLYAEECYNDSTQIKVNINPDRNHTNDMGFTTLMYFPPVYELQWVHKEPTFSGFIEWLKSKEK